MDICRGGELGRVRPLHPTRAVWVTTAKKQQQMPKIIITFRCTRVLVKHWSNIEQLDDICTHSHLREGVSSLPARWLTAPPSPPKAPAAPLLGVPSPPEAPSRAGSLL